MTKPTKTTISIPEAFAINGIKADFVEDKIQNGFDNINPDVLAGDNLNKFIDDTYKGLNYSIKGVCDLYTSWAMYDQNETYSDKSVVYDFDTSGQLKLYKSKVDNNTGNPLSDTTKWEEVSLGGSGMPVGTIFAHTCSADFVPENSLPCDGNEYTQAQFPTLYSDWLVAGRLNTCTYEEYLTEITASGECLKWALDTDSQKFKVPTIKNIFIRGAVSTAPAVGNGMTIGLTNGSTNFGLTGTRQDSVGLITNPNLYGSSLSSSYIGSSANLNGVYGLTSDPTKSGIIVDTSDLLMTQTIRYFVVVSTGSINQSEMDWSQWVSSLAEKLNIDHSNDTKPYITETYQNGTSWYRVWSDGWCEQGGIYTNSGSAGKYTITLPKSYQNTSYYVIGSITGTELTQGSVGTAYMQTGIPLTNNSFQASLYSSTSTWGNKFVFVTYGYVSEEE